MRRLGTNRRRTSKRRPGIRATKPMKPQEQEEEKGQFCKVNIYK